MNTISAPSPLGVGRSHHRDSAAAPPALATPFLAHAQRIVPAAGLSAPELEEVRAALRRRAGFTPGHLRTLASDGEHAEIELSLWRSPLGVRAYAQSGRPEMLRLSRLAEGAFHVERVLWWLTEDREPDAAEAGARLEHLRRHGPGPEGFTLRSPVPAPVRRSA